MVLASGLVDYHCDPVLEQITQATEKTYEASRPVASNNQLLA